MSFPQWSTAVAAAIADVIGSFKLTHIAPIGGGDINEAWRFDGSDTRWFVKLNAEPKLDMFAAEHEALTELAQADAVRVPRPLCSGCAAGRAFLALEYLDLKTPSAASDAALGRALARQHRRTADRFGWRCDNTIGLTTQINAPMDDWPNFWRERRLVPQLELAARNGYPELRAQAAPLLAGMDAFFMDYRPVPSLLHGDLWGGNRARLADGTPVIFDPAAYYGDREADIAMTELFGRFDSAFYAAYEKAWQLDEGYGSRRRLYNLYHVLNHLNLFGGGYAAHAHSLIASLTASL